MGVTEETLKNRLITYTPQKLNDLYDYLTQLCEYGKKNQQNSVDLNTTFTMTNNRSQDVSFIFIDNFGILMYEITDNIENHYNRIRAYSQVLRTLAEIYNIGSMIVSDSKFVPQRWNANNFDITYSTKGFVPQLPKYPHDQQIISKKEIQNDSVKNIGQTVVVKSLSVNATLENPKIFVKI